MSFVTNNRAFRDSIQKQIAAWDKDPDAYRVAIENHNFSILHPNFSGSEEDRYKLICNCNERITREYKIEFGFDPDKSGCHPKV